jgi:type I phosphodiesterase/nucleotide pyrophosphatase
MTAASTSNGIREVYTCVVRYLRMLTNAAIAGAIGAAYLTVVVLQLNPRVPLSSTTSWHWFATLAASYGVCLTVFFYVLMVAREFFSMDVMSPGWVSVRVLAWLSSAMAAGTSALMWLNVRGFTLTLGDAATRRMTAGAAAVTIAAVVLLGVAIAHYSFGRRGSRVGAALFALAAVGSLALPLAARGPAAAESRQRPPVSSGPRRAASGGPRVTMILLDGAALDYIWPRAAEGRLPNFARLLDGGASIDLATIRPTTPDSVWASVATGMYPPKSGVRSGAWYYARGDQNGLDLLPDHCFSHVLVDAGLVRDEPNTAAAWRRRPLWSILGEAGITSGVVRWPLSYPASAIDGFMLSDRFHEQVASADEFDGQIAFPPDAAPIGRSAFAAAPASAPAVPAGLRAASGDSAGRDSAYARAMRDLLARWPVRFAALRYQALDTLGHYYTTDRHARTAVEDRRGPQVLDAWYAAIDGEVGEAIGEVAPGDLLLVVSGFGMQRQDALKELAGRLLGGPDLTGTHERAPDGFLLAFGTDVQPGHRQRGSIVDIAPTLLYFLGLPVGRDMDGYARTDLFTRAFTTERPIAFIPSYERLNRGSDGGQTRVRRGSDEGQTPTTRVGHSVNSG